MGATIAKGRHRLLAIARDDSLAAGRLQASDEA